MRKLCHFYNNFLTILGFCLIGWTIFNRLFRIRLPKDIATEFTSYWQILYILIFITSLLNCIAIIYSIFRMLNKPKETLEEKSDSWLKKKFTQVGGWAVKLGDWYYGLYNMAYQQIIILLPLKVRVWFDKQLFALGVWAFSIVKNKKLMLTILLCTEIIPSLIVATSLFIDVYYFGKFQYFYISLYLMIIPIAWKALLAMLKEIAESTLENLSKYVCFKPIDPNNPEGEWSWFATVEGTKHGEIYATYDRNSRAIFVDLSYLQEIREKFATLFLSARLLTGLLYVSSWGLVVCKIWVF